MNTGHDAVAEPSKSREFPTGVTRFGILNLIACVDALTLGVFTIPRTSAFNFGHHQGTPIDFLFLLTLNVRVVAIVVLTAAGIGLLLKKSWGRSVSIGYSAGMLVFVLICTNLGGQSISGPPYSLWWYAVYPLALLIGMLRYDADLQLASADHSESADQQPRHLQFRLCHVFLAVAAACVILAQIGWWKNHPLDRELFKLKYGANSVRISAAVALGEMGSDAEVAVPALIDTMNDGYHYEYAMALMKIGTVPALTAILKHEKFPLYPNPFWPVPALGQHGPAAREAVPVLIELLTSRPGLNARGKPVEIRGYLFRDVASTLGQIGPDAKSAIPALTAIGGNPYGQGRGQEWRDWTNVCRALRQIGLEHLEGQTDVEALFFCDYDQPLTDKELRHLKGLTGLRTLGLRGAAITDTDLVHLRGMTNLEELWLGGNRSQITDEGLVHLKDLTSLKRLEIWSAHVTDLGIEHLCGLTTLESLHLMSTKVTDDGRKRLQQALPNCKIVP